MNDYKQVKKRSYRASMSNVERAIKDKKRSKNSPNVLRKRSAYISQLRLTVYAETSAKLKHNIKILHWQYDFNMEDVEYIR